MRKSTLVVLALLFSISATFAQRTITGTVSSEGEPVVGGFVVVENTTIGTFTDFEGKYSLEVPDGTTRLSFGSVGFVTKTVDLGSSNTLDMDLEPDILSLDEVLVTAYGTQAKKEITGSVVSLKNEELTKVQNSHIVQGLDGKVSGVKIISQNGQPGSSPTVLFRGIGSINASTQPLYVVDGVPFYGNINSIAQSDIESMTFLKDASASALYGSRGANGVIIITTKKGKGNGLSVTVDTRVGRNSRMVRDYDVITDPGQYYETWYNRNRIGLINQGMNADTAALTAAKELISGGGFSLGYNNYDVADSMVIDPATGKIREGANLKYNDSWYDELFQPALRSETHVSLSGNTDKTSTYLSFGYLNDGGYALQSDFSRITTRFSVDHRVNKHIEVGSNVNYAQTQQNAPLQNVGSNTYSNLFSWARNVAPIYPVYGYDENGDPILDANGDQVWDFGTNDDGIPGVRPYGAFNNPVATSLLDIDNNSRDNLSGRFYAKINFLKNFSFRYNLTADYIGSNITEFATPIGGDASNVNGRLTSTNTRANTINNQQLLNYTTGSNGHSINFLIGHESTDYQFSSLSAQKTQALISDIPFLNNATSIQYATGARSTYRVEGYFSSLNYSKDDKYFVNASLRRDGSSVFSPEARWGTFYGLGAAWEVTKEDFFNPGTWMSSLRLKTSYGQQGNDAILYQDATLGRNFYSYVDQYNVINAGGGVAGVSFVSLGNPNLTWETSINYNAGFETSLLANKVKLEVEYFVRRVNDLLFYDPLPLSEGRGSLADNVGDMENRGIEANMVADVFTARDFKWRLGANATRFNNVITRLPQDFIDDGNFRLEEGRSRFAYYMREFAGVDPATGDALWYQDEVDATTGEPTGNRITTSDYNAANEYFIEGKNAIPNVYGGFFTNFTVKNWTLDVNFAYQLGGYGYDGVYQNSLGSAPDIGQNYHKDVANSWTPENTDAELPRFDVFDTENDNQSDFWLVSTSYLSLQDVVLTYNIPRSMLSKANIASAQIYAASSNVWLWSARQGYDPRLSITGNASNEYSIMRSVSIGARVKF
jgi:TonB-linked SusC/RagA family outer membrane protein